MSSPAAQDTIRSAYLWTAASNVMKQALLFGTSMLLARLLTPSDYGLVGMVTALLVILLPIQELGISQAISYFRDKEDVILKNAAAVSLLAGVSLFALMFASAHIIAGFYNEPALVSIIRVMSIVFLLTGLRATSQGMLMRDFRFKRFAFIEFITIVIAGSTSIIMALTGFGVWSLVANYVLSAGINTILVLYFAPPRFSLDLNFATIKELLRWSLPLTGSTFLFQLSGNVDYLIVGKLLGSTTLGFYTLAFRLANMIADKVGGIVNRVSFPSLAALQSQPGGAAKHWLQLLEILGLTCFPLLAALAINARDVVELVLGTKWLPSIPILTILCGMSAFKIISPVTINFISINGRTDIIFGIAVIYSILLPCAFYIGCITGGVIGVATAWVLIYPPIVGYQFFRALRIADIRPARLVESLRLPLLVTAIYALPGLGVMLAMQPGVPRLIAGGIVFAAAMGASLLQSEVREKARRIARR